MSENQESPNAGKWIAEYTSALGHKKQRDLGLPWCPVSGWGSLAKIMALIQEEKRVDALLVGPNSIYVYRIRSAEGLKIIL